MEKEIGWHCRKEHWPWNQVECWPFAIQRRFLCCRSGACGSCSLFLGWATATLLLLWRFTGPAAATTACLWRRRRLTNCCWFCCLLLSSWGGWPAASMLSLWAPKILNCFVGRQKRMNYTIMIHTDNLENCIHVEQGEANSFFFTGWLYSPPNAPPRRGASKASCSGWPEWGQRLTKLSRNRCCCSFSCGPLWHTWKTRNKL
jgi:hypothetical protein